MRVDVYHHISWINEPPPWAKMLHDQGVLIITELDELMTDLTKLTAAVARLQASDTAALTMLQVLKDQNTALAAQLQAVQTGDPTTQAQIDAVVAALTDTADKVDAAVTANPATPNLT